MELGGPLGLVGKPAWNLVSSKPTPQDPISKEEEEGEAEGVGERRKERSDCSGGLTSLGTLDR